MANELPSHIVEGSTITNKYGECKSLEEEKGAYDSSVQRSGVSAFQRFSGKFETCISLLYTYN
jgi:hypothetical protein